MGNPPPERIRAGLRSAGAPLVALALALAATAGAAPPVQEVPGATPPPLATLGPGSAEAARVEIQRVLRRARDPQGPPAEEAALELAPFAPAGLPLLLQILRDRRVPAEGELRSQTLSEVQEAIVLAALTRLERAAVLEKTRALVGADAHSPAARDAALRVLGAVGSAAEVPTLLELPLRPEETQLLPALATSFRRAVAELVRRDRQALAQLERLWSFRREPLLLPLIEGLGDARDPRALELLDEVLVRHEHLLVPVLTQVHRVGPGPSRDLNDRLAQRLRQHLDPDRPGCRAAVFALASLRDYDSVPTLIELTAHPSTGLAQDAYHALRELTGLNLRADIALWEGWYRSETEWIETRASHVLAQLASPRHADVAAAVGELARRRLYNDHWAIELEPLLGHSSPTVRLLAARAMVALRSPYVLGGLIEALEDTSAEVQAASHRALRATTRRALPPEPALWRAAVLDTRT